MSEDRDDTHDAEYREQAARERRWMRDVIEQGIHAGPHPEDEQ